LKPGVATEDGTRAFELLIDTEPTMPKVDIRGAQPKRPDKNAVTQTEPNSSDKPLPRTGPQGSGAVEGGEDTKPGQLDPRGGSGKGS